MTQLLSKADCNLYGGMFVGLSLVSSREATVLCAASSKPDSKDRDFMGIEEKQTCGTVLRQIIWVA